MCRACRAARHRTNSPTGAHDTHDSTSPITGEQRHAKDHDRTADAIRHALVSPNECDTNGEAVNDVGGLYYLGRCVVAAGREVAAALRELAEAHDRR